MNQKYEEVNTLKNNHHKIVLEKLVLEPLIKNQN